MESPVESSIGIESISSIASSLTCQEDVISPEEQFLMQKLDEAVLEATEENISFAKEIGSLLSTLDLEPQSLSSDVREGLQKVALILQHEKLLDMDEITMSVASERRKVEEKKKEREEKKLALMYTDLSRKYTNFSKKLDYLSNSVNILETTVDAAMQEEAASQANHQLLFTKLSEYQQTVEKLEADLEAIDIEEIHPTQLLKKYDTYLELSAELLELNTCLNQYEGLPTNLSQAKLFLEATQKEYECLHQAFLQKMGS